MYAGSVVSHANGLDQLWFSHSSAASFVLKRPLLAVQPLNTYGSVMDSMISCERATGVSIITAP